MQRSKRFLTVICLVLLLISLIFYGIYWAFFDTQRINGQELIAQSESPQGAYTVSAYLNNGGATTSYAVLCVLEDHQTGKSKNIYWQDQCFGAKIVWEDEEHVVINGKRLNVERDVYDFRKSP